MFFTSCWSAASGGRKFGMIFCRRHGR
jgi:hypothetical protein